MALVDFAHTPNSLRRSLRVARTLVSGRVIAVFGLRRPAGCRKTGHDGPKLQPTWPTSPSSPPKTPAPKTWRHSWPKQPRQCRPRAALRVKRFERVPDRWPRDLSSRPIGPARRHRYLPWGKGHEQSMCFGETEYPWDDRQAMRSALQGAPLLTLPSAGSEGAAQQ